MDLGEKLRMARTEAGLSQKQLCQDLITRNMLSQIENGSASPSMKTLTELARRLGKNVSYFLEETAVLSPNTQIMDKARAFYDCRNFSGALEVLESYRSGDNVYDREASLIRCLCRLALAGEAIREGRNRYAGDLLEQTVLPVYCTEALERQRLLLMGELGMPVCGFLPGLDEELRLRAREAEKGGRYERAGSLLDACENREEPLWQLQRGRLYLAQKNYPAARTCLEAAEGTFPADAAPLLEVCCRELGDYRAAYEYACRQKKR